MKARISIFFMVLAGVLLCASLVYGFLVSSPRHHLPDRVLVIGLDGADFDRMDPLLKRGELPNLQRLIQGGARGTLLSMIPSISPASWVAFTSGKNPGKTGVLHFLHPKPDNRYEVYDIRSDQCRVKRIWDILSDNDKHVIIQGVPVTYPPEPVTGVMISGWLAPKNSVFTYPPELSEKYSARGYVTFVEQVKVWGPYTPPEQYENTLNEHLKIDAVRQATFQELMTENPWDFAMVVFENIDHIQHVISTDMAPVEQYYRRMDSVVGDLVESAGKNTLIVIGSDHGFGRVHRNFNPRDWLLKQKLLAYKPAEEYLFSGSISADRPFEGAVPVDFDESGDSFHLEDRTIQFSGKANFGEDGVDFRLPPGTSVQFSLNITSPGNETLSIPVVTGSSNYLIRSGVFSAVTGVPSGSDRQSTELRCVHGDGSDNPVEVDLGAVTVPERPWVMQVIPSATALTVLDYVKLVDTRGQIYVLESEDLLTTQAADIAPVAGTDGKWWNQTWERFRHGSALVAHPGETPPALRLIWNVAPGEYRLMAGTYSGEPSAPAMLTLEVAALSPGESSEYSYGKPLYQPGVHAGFFVWQDVDGWHLRWSGSAKQSRTDIDWSRTYAWDPFWSVSPYGSLFLNVNNREPNGQIPAEEYLSARQALADRLMEYRDPETSQPVVIKTYFREDLYSGPYAGELPDIVYEVDSDYCIYHRVVGSHHKRDGILILNGPGIGQGVNFTANIIDVTPTLLYAMNIPVADDMDGRPVLDAFTPAFQRAFPLLRQDSYESGNRVNQPDTERGDLSDEVQERLRALGYIK